MRKVWTSSGRSVTWVAVAPSASVFHTWVEPERLDRKYRLPSGPQRPVEAPWSDTASRRGSASPVRSASHRVVTPRLFSRSVARTE